jgi:hypothetical protein
LQQAAEKRPSTALPSFLVPAAYFYVRLLGISRALYLDIFEQPAHQVYFSNLINVQFFEKNQTSDAGSLSKQGAIL